MKLTLLGFSVATLLATGPASATPLASDDFSYTGPLTSNGWSAHSGAGNKVISSDGSAATLEQSGGSGEDVSLSFTAQGATDTTFASFDVTLPSDTSLGALDGSGLYFAHFKDDSFGFRARTFITTPTGSGDFGFGLSADDSSYDVSTGDFSFGTTYNLIISYNASTGASSLWVNPTAGSEGAPTLTDATGTTGTPVEAFSLRQSNDYTGSIIIDNVVAGTTFASVIPEPSSLALLGLGGLLVARRRRG